MWNLNGFSLSFKLLNTSPPKCFSVRKLYTFDMHFKQLLLYRVTDIQRGIPAKVVMIIQRVVLNSRPGMYLFLTKDQCILYNCVILLNGEGNGGK